MSTADDPARPSNRQAFATVEFKYWAHHSGVLGPEERFLLDHCLHAEKSTLEAGTGGGRLLLYLQSRGFQHLRGFDQVPAMVEQARRNDMTGTIQFDVQDAVSLDYPDEAFDQLIYLQKILCFMECPDERQRAAQEAYRVLRPGGTAIFSFLCYEARSREPLARAVLVYLRLRRRLVARPLSLQYLPWLRRGGRPNVWGLLRDAAPYVYYPTMADAQSLLEDVGFGVCRVGSGYQLQHGRLCTGLGELRKEAVTDAIYFVCGK